MEFLHGHEEAKGFVFNRMAMVIVRMFIKFKNDIPLKSG